MRRRGATTLALSKDETTARLGEMLDRADIAARGSWGKVSFAELARQGASRPADGETKGEDKA